MTTKKWYAIAATGVLATLLDLANGVYLLLAAKRHATEHILSIVTLVTVSLLSICNVIALIVRSPRRVLYYRGLLLVLGLSSLILVGTIASMALLETNKPFFGDDLCSPGQGACLLNRNGAILLAFLLWIAAGLTQTSFTILFFSVGTLIKSDTLSSINSAVASPMQPITPDGLVRQTQVRRIPIMRQDTSDEPFSYEAALQAKSTPPLPNHQSSQSGSSHLSNMAFVQTHMTHASHSRSWASTLPTAVSGLSPRSFYGGAKHSTRGSDDQSVSVSRRDSPIKSEWSAWGLALGSPRHKVQKENASVSTTSTGRSRPAKSLKNFKFHLPSSPDMCRSSENINSDTQRQSPKRAEDDDHSPDAHTINPLGLEGIDALSKGRSTSSPRLRRKQTSKADNQASLFPPLRSVTTSNNLTGSPERRRASFLEVLKPRLSHSKSLSRNSWIARSVTSSPTKSQTWRSSTHTPQDSPTEDAFAQWDTSNVEQDPSYLVSMKDYRDISGSSPYPQAPTRQSIELEDTESLWGNRSVRVASDGSVIARDAAQKDVVHRLSSKQPGPESVV